MFLLRPARISLKEQRDGRQSVAMLIREFGPEFKQECQAVGVQSLAWPHETARQRPCSHGVKAASCVDSSLEARPVKRVLYIASSQLAQHFDDCILAKVRSIRHRWSPIAVRETACRFVQQPRIFEGHPANYFNVATPDCVRDFAGDHEAWPAGEPIASC